MSNLTPIQINITDDGKFADMAYFFDYPRVLSEIIEAREVWTDGKVILNSETEKFITEPKSKDLAKHYWCTEFGRRIAKKFYKPATYIRPITAAILSNEVSDIDYSTIFIDDTFQYYGVPDSFRLNNRIAIISDRVRACDLPSINLYEDKSIATVRQHRRWFLMKQYGGLGYRGIAKQEYVPLSTIQTAINSYKARIIRSFQAS